MKKLNMKLMLVVFACLFMASFAMADSNYTSQNAVILGPFMGAEGITPPVEIIKVSVGSEDNVLVGSVMAWNVDQSTDGEGLGFVVDVCTRSSSGDIAITAHGKGPYAGVMVTTASYDKANIDAGGDGGATFDVTDVRGSNGAVGYMALRGYVDALIMNGSETLGELLMLAGLSESGYFQTKADNAGAGGNTSFYLSEDIGVLLETVTANGLARVWLR